MPPGTATDEPTPGRRALLRSGAAAAAGLLGSTAGCVELLPPLGQRVRYGDVELPEPRDPEYRRWVPAASALPDGVGGDVADDVGVATPRSDGSDVVGAPLSFGTNLFAVPLDYFGLGVAHYDRIVEAGPGFVLEGEFDADLVTETLTRSGYEPAGAYEGYELFTRDDQPRVAAVADGTIVWSHHRDGVATARACTEAIVDAGAGRVERLHRVDGAFAEITELTGTWPFVDVGTVLVDPTGEALTGAWVHAYDEDFVYSLHHALYPEGSTVSETAVRRALEEDPISLEAQLVDVVVDGRLASVVARNTHDRYVSEYEPEYPPQVTWGVEFGAGDELTLRHEAGDAVAAEALEVELRSGGAEDRPTDAQFTDEHDVVAPGDALTVETGDADRLVVAWTSPSEQQWATIGNVELP